MTVTQILKLVSKIVSKTVSKIIYEIVPDTEYARPMKPFFIKICTKLLGASRQFGR